MRALGVVDLPLLQRKANFHMSLTRDLFGSEISRNGGEAFSAGLKGRLNEAKLSDDQKLQDALCRSPRWSMVSWGEPGASAARDKLPPAGGLHRRLPGASTANGRCQRPKTPKNGVIRCRAANHEGLFSVA